MPKQVKQKRRPTDENQIAFDLVRRSTEQSEQPATPVNISEYMRAMGTKGGKLSAKARMKKISPENRSAIAHRAARARWAKTKKAREG